MEFVDIVNEKDEVIGNCSKAEAHEKGLLHRTVIAEVVNSQGEYILVRQASDKQDAGQFVSPIGGHVMSGESEDDAIKREASEELGISNFQFKLKGKSIYNREVNGHKENHLFVVYEIKSDQTPVLNEESVEYKYFSLDQLKIEFDQHPSNIGLALHVVAKNFYKEWLS